MMSDSNSKSQQGGCCNSKQAGVKRREMLQCEGLNTSAAFEKLPHRHLARLVLQSVLRGACNGPPCIT